MTYITTSGSHSHTFIAPSGGGGSVWPSQWHGSITPLPPLPPVTSNTPLDVDFFNGIIGNINQLSTITTKENTMSTIEQVRNERRERKERERIEALYEMWDSVDLEADLLTFTWTSPNSEKSYDYAALFTNDRWYLTGAQSPNGITTEQLIDWFVEKNLYPSDITEIN